MIELEIAKLENDISEYETMVRADILNGSQFADDMRRDLTDRLAHSIIVYELPDHVKYQTVKVY